MIILTLILSLFSYDLSGQFTAVTQVDQDKYGLKYSIDFDDGDGKFFRIISTDYVTGDATIVTGSYRIVKDVIHFRGRKFNKWLADGPQKSIEGNSYMKVRYRFENGYLMLSFDGGEYQPFIAGNPLNGKVITDDRQF